MAVRARPLGQLHRAAGQAQEVIIDGIKERAHGVPGQGAIGGQQLRIRPDGLAIAALPQAYGLGAAQVNIERGRLGGRGQGQLRRPQQ